MRSCLVRLWRKFLEIDLFHAKPIDMHMCVIYLLFSIGLCCIFLVSNYGSYPFITQSRVLFQDNSPWFPHVTPPNITNYRTTGIGTPFIDYNSNNPIPSVRGKDVDVVQYQNTSTTWHHLNYEDLQQKASLTSPKPLGAKIAFMFLVKDNIPFAPLWERYFRGHEDKYSIYIHAIPNYIPHFDPTSPFYKRFVPSKVCTFSSLLCMPIEF